MTTCPDTIAMNRVLAVSSLVLLVFGCISAQSINSGTVTGTVKDPSGAIAPNATVEIRNPVTGYQQATTSDASGKFRFNNVPFNGYSLTATLSGFNPVPQNVNIRSTLPVDVTLALALTGASTSITVESGMPWQITSFRDVQQDLG